MHKQFQKEDLDDWPHPGLKQQPNIIKYSYSIYSQNGEDGILRYLTSELEQEHKYFVEFGFHCFQNNSMRLVLKEDFCGMYIDTDRAQVMNMNKISNDMGWGIVAKHGFIRKDNINTLIGDVKCGDIGVLSIDIDGNDYWIWNEISVVHPRIVIIEYNASLGKDVSLTIPYEDDFKRHEKFSTGMYYGASLSALKKLGENKGFRLVGCDANGINAFFLENSYMTHVPELTVEEAFRPNAYRAKRGFSEKYQFESIKDLPYEEI